MSGHSKWSKIKRQKGANDAAKGKVFAKLSKEISLAVQEGGVDPVMNFTLRMAIDKAKAANFPLDNIDRAIKKGAGELKDGNKIIEVLYEAYGPAGVGVLIKSNTDYTNRTITEIRQIVENGNGGKMAPEGSVSWQFEQKGVLTLENKVYQESGKFGKEGVYVHYDLEEMTLELMGIEGVEDIVILGEEGGISTLEVVSSKDDFHKVALAISEHKFKIIDSGLGYKPTQTVPVKDKQDSLDKLISELEDSDEVDEVWDNSN